MGTRYSRPREEAINHLPGQPTPAFVKSNGLENAVLCAACKKLFSGKIGSHSRKQSHHDSVASLYKGKELGCRICILIWGRMSEKQRQYMKDRLGDKFELSTSHHYWGHLSRDDAYSHYRVLVELFVESTEVETIRIDLALELVEGK
jgi:hypothetical protein